MFSIEVYKVFSLYIFSHIFQNDLALLKKVHSTHVFFQISAAQNRVYLNAGTLMLNINDEDYEAGLKGINKGSG